MCVRGHIPDRLRELESATDIFCLVRAWDELADSLYHQGDVFVGSYAAVPHMVRICDADRSKLDFNLFFWVGAIEEARWAGKRNPQLPNEFESSYDAAMRTMHRFVLELSAERWEPTLAQCIISWQLVVKGHIEAAQQVGELPWRKEDQHG